MWSAGTNKKIMKNLLKALLIAVLTLGVVSTTATSCKNAGKAVKNIAKVGSKGSKGSKVRPPIVKHCSHCGTTYRGFDCPNCGR